MEQRATRKPEPSLSVWSAEKNPPGLQKRPRSVSRIVSALNKVYSLCDLGEIAQPLWALISLTVWTIESSGMKNPTFLLWN